MKTSGRSAVALRRRDYGKLKRDAFTVSEVTRMNEEIGWVNRREDGGGKGCERDF